VVTKISDSSVPSLGYTRAYAFANVLLTIMAKRKEKNLSRLFFMKIITQVLGLKKLVNLKEGTSERGSLSFSG
jgi:hypothetical protein